MKTIATLAFLLSLLILPSHASERPNVLMIVVDDMNDWVGCLGGHPLVKTPNIDRLAKRGTLFTNAHCAAPVCNASRVATLTGLRPSTTGIYDNSVKWQDHLSSTTSLPQHFKRNGYTVLGGGKVFHHMPYQQALTGTSTSPNSSTAISNNPCMAGKTLPHFNSHKATHLTEFLR